jgi:hypothetical protein
MTLLVSYMPESRIETDAEALLDEFAKATGMALTAPVPIDDIVEKHLKLGIEFDDLHRRFGAPNSVLAQGPDIIGAIFLSQRRIVVDEFLDPDADPSKEGRYRFTVAHEVGHWRLHRGLMGKDMGACPSCHGWAFRQEAPARASRLRLLGADHLRRVRLRDRGRDEKGTVRLLPLHGLGR